MSDKCNFSKQLPKTEILIKVKNIIFTWIQRGSDSWQISDSETGKFHEDLKGKEQNSRYKWRDQNTHWRWNKLYVWCPEKNKQTVNEQAE